MKSKKCPYCGEKVYVKIHKGIKTYFDEPLDHIKIGVVIFTGYLHTCEVSQRNRK